MNNNKETHILCPYCNGIFDGTEVSPIIHEGRETMYKRCPHCKAIISIPQAFSVGDYIKNIKEQINELEESELYKKCLDYLTID